MYPKPDDIALICLEKFNKLPKSGKPTSTEWTVLTAIVLYSSKSNISKVVSIGTGTKCIGHNQLCSKGWILNDSHAEVMARRGFLRYIMNEAINVNKSQILTYDSKISRFKLNDDVSFHCFSSHLPCGDASIIDSTLFADEDNTQGTASKRPKLVDLRACATNSVIGDESNFTGAKLLTPSDGSDPMDQEVGVLRIKPGRGERTLSMSCSDKISRWCMLGIQGALLLAILDRPIYLKSFTFCGKFSAISVRRAIWGRWDKSKFINDKFPANEPEIRQCSTGLTFEFSKNEGRQPSPTSIVWTDVSERPLEVAVSGKRQGATKKSLNNISGYLQICKANLLKLFLKTIDSQKDLCEHFSKKLILLKSYKEIKDISIDYQCAWTELKTKCFEHWTEKPDFLLNFSVQTCK